MPGPDNTTGGNPSSRLSHGLPLSQLMYSDCVNSCATKDNIGTLPTPDVGVIAKPEVTYISSEIIMTSSYWHSYESTTS